jgi:hypothetical protein
MIQTMVSYQIYHFIFFSPFDDSLRYTKQLICFSFVVCAFGVESKSLIQSYKLSQIVFFWKFCHLNCCISIYDEFKLTFVCVVRKGFIPIFAYRYSVFPSPLLKILFFFHWIILAPLSKINWSLMWGLFFLFGVLRQGLAI